MFHTLKKWIRIFGVQVKNNFVREAVYRTNFLTMMLVDVIWIAVEFSLFKVIYANSTTLGGWTQEQTFFFLGIFFASDALFTTFFQRNFWQFSDLVNRGELDILLTKPTSPLLLALTRWMSLTTIFNIGLGIAIMIRYAGPAGFAGGWKWFLVPVWLLIGVLTALLLRFAFSVWVFWTERSWALSRLYYQFFHFATKPDVIFPGVIRYAIMTFIPFAFIGSVPTRALLNGLEPREYVWSPQSSDPFFYSTGFSGSADSLDIKARVHERSPRRPMMITDSETDHELKNTKNRSPWRPIFFATNFDHP